ncbi:alpha/beta hydrolase [Thioclava sp. SK-1]|uniref:alpha/beta fold hydrolase n=1 Tax=Thioclava sp. SK-1 TaxID=1889770 RepID=UPI000826CE6D|nr:alpha/beta hydrolase [Thioclava sp. SK-1]OCX60972.1 alpha/beta hydrolase [Thioclava sp. SK-1]
MQGEPLLFLPGFMCDARLFWHQINEISSQRPVMVAPLTGASIPEMAEAVLRHAPPKMALVGHWLGGLVAMEILRRAPDRVSQLALINVNPLSETPALSALREQRIVKARIGRLDEAMLDEIPTESLDPGAHRSQVQAMMLDMAHALGPDRFEDQSRALMRRPDQQRTLRSNRIRALLLCGEFDTICPPRRHEFLAELMPHAEFKPILSAGHFSPLEQPEKVTAALQAWLSAPLLLK